MHFHIRWSDSKLDWQRFDTREEAEQAARQMLRPGETFTVVHVEEKTCVQKTCKLMIRKELDLQ